MLRDNIIGKVLAHKCVQYVAEKYVSCATLTHFCAMKVNFSEVKIKELIVRQKQCERGLVSTTNTIDFEINRK